jgi:hypothetical protein
LMDNSMKKDLGNNDGGSFRALFLSQEAWDPTILPSFKLTILKWILVW